MGIAAIAGADGEVAAGFGLMGDKQRFAKSVYLDVQIKADSKITIKKRVSGKFTFETPS